MYDRSEPIESLLLDWHLKRLEPADAERVAAALDESPELRAQSDGLGDVLAALDRTPAPEPPGNLADRVLERIEEQTRVIPMTEAASAVPAGTSHELAASPVLSLRELIAIAACITLFVGIFIPGYFKAKNIARRNLCANNLRMMWSATSQYAEDNGDYLPYSGYVAGASFLPSRVPNIRRVSNTQPWFKLLKNGYLEDNDPRVFICPSAQGSRPMLAENYDYEQFSDFVEPANVSYSFLYMNRPEGRNKNDNDLKKMVVIGDRNPLFDQRGSAHNISPYGDGNSLTHEGGAGQNVLYMNGNVDWQTTPRVGENKDHIYRAGEQVNYQGTEKPTCETDIFLVP